MWNFKIHPSRLLIVLDFSGINSLLNWIATLVPIMVSSALSETGWHPCELSNCSVLKVGSGAGRFSEVFLCNWCITCSYSSAVEANT